MSSSFTPADFAAGRTSRLPNFNKRSLPERAAIVAQWAGLSAQEQAVLLGLAGLQPGQADHLLENVVGTFALPLAIAVNFQINDREVLVPMVTAEPGVVAACSSAANLARAHGGFKCRTLMPPAAGGFIQIGDLPDLPAAAKTVQEAQDDLRAETERAMPALGARGGRLKEIVLNPYPETAAGPALEVILEIDSGDLSSAEASRTVQAACEALAARIVDLIGGRAVQFAAMPPGIRRLVRAECTVTADLLERPAAEGESGLDGQVAARAIAEQSALAAVDSVRGFAHRQGILNAACAIALATGNDPHAMAVWAHAYAEVPGRRALAVWTPGTQGRLHGSLALPVPVALPVAGPAPHPGVQVALKILGVKNADELAHVVAAAGLAQNLAALHASAHEPILPGHLDRQARALARAAGADDALVEQVARRLLDERNVKLERAQELVAEMAHGQ